MARQYTNTSSIITEKTTDKLTKSILAIADNLITIFDKVKLKDPKAYIKAIRREIYRLSIMLSLIIFTCLSLFQQSCLAENLPVAPIDMTVQAVSENNNITPIKHYCPTIKELTKDGLWWSARAGKWKSYSQSFASEIDHFIGAQWLGVVVGKIICLYQGRQSFDFPIALEPAKAVLALEPQSDNWLLRKNGLRACLSTNIMDCPFYTQKARDNSHIYDDIKYHSQNYEENSQLL